MTAILIPCYTEIYDKGGKDQENRETKGVVSMFRLLIVDDEYYVRVGIKSAIDWSEIGVEVVGEAADGEEALEMAFSSRPDIILTDVRMPFMDGLTLMEQLRSKMPECGFIVLSGHNEFEYARQAIRQGAFAYLLKPIDRQELKDTVFAAMRKMQDNRNAREYYDVLSGEYFELQQRFLQNLLQGGLVSADRIVSRLEELHLPVITRPYIVTMLCRNDSEGSGNAQEELVKKTLQMRLADFRQKKQLVLFSTCKWCVVGETEGEGSAELQKCAQWWEETVSILQQETGAVYSVGISSIWQDFGEVSRACEEARHAADIKGFCGLNSVVLYQNVFSACRRSEVLDAMKYIKNHFYENVTVESAAQSLGISASRLMHIFKENVGITFNECVMESRIHAAIRLMKTGKYRIYEVAELVGYTDIRHFSQVFKKFTGVMPDTYRKDLV